MHHPVSLDPKENRQLGDLAQPVMRISGLVGIVGIAASLVIGFVLRDHFRHFLHSYLVAYCTFLSIALGAVFFVALQHLTGAAWSVTCRRLAEIVAANLPLMAILSLPIIIPMVLGNHELYPWNDAEAVRVDELLAKKRPYLNVPFFLIRLAFFFIFWGGLSTYFFSRSRRQDSSGDATLTDKMRGVSAPAILLYALTVTFAAFDLLMSLTPKWYSTIFGVYFFAGGLVGFHAFLILMAMILQKTGRLTSSITVEHYHDLGKFLFGFVFFWGYIAFSQYLLIWYAALPEETIWYAARQDGTWVYVSLLLLFGNFILPFLGLLSRHAKRRKGMLAFWSIVLLFMHWVDMYYLVMPNLFPGQVPLHILDLTCLAGIGGVFLFGIARNAGFCSLLPEKDPRLAQSLAFQNV
jgi:hypothetical protein